MVVLSRPKRGITVMVPGLYGKTLPCSRRGTYLRPPQDLPETATARALTYIRPGIYLRPSRESYTSRVLATIRRAYSFLVVFISLA